MSLTSEMGALATELDALSFQLRALVVAQPTAWSSKAEPAAARAKLLACKFGQAIRKSSGLTPSVCSPACSEGSPRTELAKVCEGFTGRGAASFPIMDKPLELFDSAGKEVPMWLHFVLPRAERPIAIDVGGNSGQETIPLAAKGFEVHTFEPVAAFAQMIRDKAASAKYDKVTVHQVALSDAEAETVIYVTGERSAMDFKLASEGAQAQAVSVRVFDTGGFAIAPKQVGFLKSANSFHTQTLDVLGPADTRLAC